MRKTYRIIAAILCAVTILGAPVQAQAAAGAYIKQSEYDSFRALFDAQYYYNKYGDLQQVIGYDEEKLFEHYMTYGIFEGRSGCAEFNLLYYMKNNEDVKAAFGNNYTAYCKHYLEYGRAEQRTAATAELFTAEPTNELGRYTTYYDTTEERALNVEVAASRINGVVLQPGEKFSFSRTILPRTRANGYGMGPVIIGGKIVRGMGGGICQVSSTLYAAMVMAGTCHRALYSLPADGLHPPGNGCHHRGHCQGFEVREPLFLSYCDHCCDGSRFPDGEPCTL